MKKALLSIFLPIAGVCAAVFAFSWWERGAPPGFRPTPVDVRPSTITTEHRGVRIQGTAHLEARLRQSSEGTTHWVYPLMEKGDRDSRLIRVLVRTTVEPNSLYAYEDRSLEGFARPPGRLLPRAAQEPFEKKGYQFDEHVVLIEEWVD